MSLTVDRIDVKSLIPTYENSLKETLAFYANWNDVLSVRIKRWASHLDGDSVRKLFEEVLVDCIHGRPLNEPVLERAWTWERTVHSQYRTIDMHSPMDGQKMLEDPPEHAFAMKILRLVLEYSSESEVALPTSHESQLTVAVSESELLIDAGEALAAEMVREMGDMVVEADESQARIVREREILTQIALAEAETLIVLHSEMIQKEIRDMETSYSEGIRDLEGRLVAREEDHKKSMEAMQNRVSCLESTRAEEAAILKSRMQECQKSYEESRRVLEGHIASQRAMQATLQQRIGSLEATSTSAVGALTQKKELPN
jgi:hypothetical protein